MVTWKTLDEIAEHLKASASTVYKLKQRGVIRGYRVGRNLRFDLEEVDLDIKKSGACPSATENGRGESDQSEVC
jgi:excisionase family DNA binding protein